MLSNDDGSDGDEWIAQMLSTASSDAIATFLILPGGDVPLDPQSNDQEGEDIVITGRRIRDTDDDSGSTGGETGYTGWGSGGDGGGGTAGPPTGAEQHTQDCGTEDGAAVQIAKHVIGALPAGVSGPPDPMTTSAGNDWKTVEFGAIIIRNADGELRRAQRHDLFEQPARLCRFAQRSRASRPGRVAFASDQGRL